ncbi:MAG: HD domain-containing phosphohydrolase [Gammaproteobacteria bacterium]|jgi:HD-GYP domain-containing protein (c-di-GMP phosphodiesterase class II)
MTISKIDFSKLLKEITDIGIALSAEKDHSRLLDMILLKAKEITNADGGSLYIHTVDQQLKFEIIRTDSLEIHMGGTSDKPIDFYPVSLYDKDGNPNNNMVVARAALTNKTVNVVDAYESTEFDFSGAKNFDKKTGYRSRSFLTVPMTNHINELIGVLQLINAIDPNTGDVTTFSELDQQIVESMASQAAVTITNRNLIDAQKELFDSFIQLIAGAVDEKSPYTAGHCRRVPVITNMLAVSATNIDVGPLKDFSMNEEEKYELDVAAWLHDCGKITTPEYVVDKGTKLETIFDRIHIVDARFEIIRRDAIVSSLLNRLAQRNDEDEYSLETDDDLQSELVKIEQDREYIKRCNIGGEQIAKEQIDRINAISIKKWNNSNGEEQRLLLDEEVQNLQIGRGTLSVREREIINNHVSVTIKMLEALPYPKHLKRVPEFAGCHHEKMNGTGYPKGLTKEEMSIPARMVAIADVFEALTANDRPYKKAMGLKQSLSILGQMKLDGHVDPDLFDVFMHDKIYLKYAQEHLDPAQIDEIDHASIPGYESLN